MSMEQAALLAFKVIEEAIEVGAYGLGPPIEVWQVLPSGLKALDESQIAVLNDTAGQLRDYEIQLLRGELPQRNEEAASPVPRQAEGKST